MARGRLCGAGASAREIQPHSIASDCHKTELNRRRRFPGWAKERQRRNLYIRLQAHRLDRDFHLQLCSQPRMRGLHAGQGNHLFQDRRPTGSRRLAHLLFAGIQWHRHARSLARRGGREPVAFIQSFHIGPIHFDSDQLPRHAILRVLLQRPLADEIFLLEMHHLGEAQFVRRIFLRRN